MRKPQGYAILIDPDAPCAEEWDTFTCCHCNCIVNVKPRCDPTEAGGFCRLCYSLVCPRCAGGACTPFEKKLDEYEKRMAGRQSFLKGMGLV